MARDLIAELEQRQAQQPQQPQGRDLIAELEQTQAQQDRPLSQKISDFVTGAGKNPENLPEITDYGTDWVNELKIAGGQLASFTPEQQADIIRKRVPDAKVTIDENGYVLVEKDGQRGYVNKPGASWNDLTDFVGKAAAFALPASWMSKGNAGMAIGGKMLTQGLTAGGTSVVLDAASGAAGSEQGISPGRALLSAATAGLAEGAMPFLGAVAKRFGGKSGAADVSKITAPMREKIAVELGVKADDITDDLLRGILESGDDVSIRAASGRAAAKEFDIPLTRGQSTLDDIQLAREDALRSAGSEKAKRVLNTFRDEQQIPAINAAKDKVVSSISQADDVTRPADAGGVLAQGIRNREMAADQAVKELYDQVGDAALEPKAINGLFNSVRKAVIGHDFDRTLPETAKMLGELKRGQSVLVNLEKAGGTIKPRHIKEIENMRRRLGTAIDAASGNKADRRQLVIMKRAFDDFIDKAEQQALFSGDDTALAALKEARAGFRDYAKLYRSGGKYDQAGKTVETIIEGNPTDEQVINSLFGANNLSKNGGANVAKRFKEILGPDSKEWDAVRMAGLQRIIKTKQIAGQDVLAGQQSLTNLNKMLEQNKSLLDELYTPEQIGQMRRLFAVVARTEKGATRSASNPSGTAAQIKSIVENGIFRGFIDSQTGGAGGIILSVTKGGRAAGQAKNAIRPFEQMLQTPQGMAADLTRGTLIEGGRRAIDR